MFCCGRLPDTAKLLPLVELETPVPPVFSQVKFTTPGFSVISSSKLRPLSGKSFTCCSPTSPEMSWWSRSRAAHPHHCNLLADFSNVKMQIHGGILPHRELNSCPTSSANPCFFTRTSYGPPEVRAPDIYPVPSVTVPR